MGPLDKQNLLKSQTSRKVKAANVPMKNISQKTIVRLSRSVNTNIPDRQNYFVLKQDWIDPGSLFRERVSRLEFEVFSWQFKVVGQSQLQLMLEMHVGSERQLVFEWQYTTLQQMAKCFDSSLMHSFSREKNGAVLTAQQTMFFS